MIKKTDSGRYRVILEAGYKLNGKRDRICRTFDTLTEAKKFERENEPHSTYSRATTFQEFVEVVYIPLKKDSVRKSTFTCYMRDIKKLMGVFGNRALDEIDHIAIQKLLNQCETKKIATNLRNTLRQILNEAIYSNIITSNPANDRYRFPEEKIRHDEDKEIWLSTFKEHIEFIAALRGRKSELYALLGLGFGLRKGEIFGLDWSHVDFANKAINIRQTYVDGENGFELRHPKTLASVRTIPMNDFTYQRLKEIKASRKIVGFVDSPVVINHLGVRTNPKSASKILKRDEKELELPNLTMLMMRHSFASACINSGIEVSHVSKMLGHTTISTTYNRYVLPKLNDMTSSIDIINESIFEAL